MSTPKKVCSCKEFFIALGITLGLFCAVIGLACILTYAGTGIDNFFGKLNKLETLERQIDNLDTHLRMTNDSLDQTDLIAKKRTARLQKIEKLLAISDEDVAKTESEVRAIGWGYVSFN